MQARCIFFDRIEKYSKLFTNGASTCRKSPPNVEFHQIDLKMHQKYKQFVLISGRVATRVISLQVWAPCINNFQDFCIRSKHLCQDDIGDSGNSIPNARVESKQKMPGETSRIAKKVLMVNVFSMSSSYDFDTSKKDKTIILWWSRRILNPQTSFSPDWRDAVRDFWHDDLAMRDIWL